MKISTTVKRWLGIAPTIPQEDRLRETGLFLAVYRRNAIVFSEPTMELEVHKQNSIIISEPIMEVDKPKGHSLVGFQGLFSAAQCQMQLHDRLWLYKRYGRGPKSYILAEGTLYQKEPLDWLYQAKTTPWKETVEVGHIGLYNMLVDAMDRHFHPKASTTPPCPPE